MKYDIWKVNKKTRATGDDGEEFEATGLFVNKGFRIGYRVGAKEPQYDGPVVGIAVNVTGSVLVETVDYQYIITQLKDEGMH